MSITSDNAVICVIAFREEPYLNEWIEYHFALGFSHIYIYDNNPTPGGLRHFERDDVTIIHWPGHAAQYPAFRHFLASNSAKTAKWVSFHDCDEFIVLKKHKNIIDFLTEHCTSGAISLNWYLYGTSGHEKQTPEPVTKRFVRRQEFVNDHVKSICCIADVETIYNAHFPILKQSHASQHDTTGHIFQGPFNPNGPTDVACVNHYWCKSKEEYAVRYLGYGGDGIHKTVKLDEMEHTNHTYDPVAWHFYSRHKQLL
jgi:hypothetical protein